VINDLARRIYEYKIKAVKGFTEKYNLNELVYFEETVDVTAAIEREKEIKKCPGRSRTRSSIRSIRNGEISVLISKISRCARNEKFLHYFGRAACGRGGRASCPSGSDGGQS
jgi:predicted GIY-YIG superfamily endonuclease